jgi:hypothetical protein
MTIREDEEYARHCDYIEALEDALNAYDAAFLTLGLCHKLDKGSMALYTETRAEHHSALRQAIDNCITRNSRGNKTSR